MKKVEIVCRLTEFESANQLTPEDQELLSEAKKTAQNAYAPYSRFNVGAAVLLENGKTILGNNQENASYPLGLCAERVAIFSASAQYPGVPVKAIAITARSDEFSIDKPVAPCGACRQAIAEYEHLFAKNIRLILSGESGKIITSDSIANFLPFQFNGDDLKKKMTQDTGENYLLETLKSLKGLKSNTEKAMEQITEKEMFFSANVDSNSVAILIKHISGNMMSRFTDFLTTDGEKPDRNRDGEFTREIFSRDELMSRWNEGWNCLFNTLSELTPGDLSKEVLINKEKFTVLRALTRAMVHYAVHTGQIVYICKEIRSDEFKTLSIPLKKNV